MTSNSQGGSSPVGRHGGRRRWSAAVAAGVAATLLTGQMAFAEPIVGLNGTGPTDGTIVAVSGTGDAYSSQGVAVSATGNANGGAGAVSATGRADQRCSNINQPTPGVAASGLGESEGCTATDAMLTWVDTPNGPEAVGPGVETIVGLAKAVVAGAEDVLGQPVVSEEAIPLVEVTHEWVEDRIPPPPPPPPVPSPPNPVSDTAGFVAWASPGTVGATWYRRFGSYDFSCADNAWCNGLRAKKRHRFPVEYYHPDYGIRAFYGIIVGSYLVPTSSTSNGLSYDAFFVFGTVTGDQAGMCGISNYAQMKGGNEAFVMMSPTGTDDKDPGETVTLGVNVGPFSLGSSWPSYKGRVRGDYNPGKARATGSWTYRGNNCPNQSVAMGTGASYEWPRGVSREYEVGFKLTWQWG
jgi:hypothetical protein